MICDLCSDPNPTWKYPCKDIAVGALSIPDKLIQTSFGGWAACDACHNLIEANNRIGLAVRSAMKLIEGESSLAGEALQLVIDLRRVHADFFDSRDGPAEPADPNQTSLGNRVVITDPETCELLASLAGAGCTIQETAAFMKAQGVEAS